eukprot:gene1284-1984_t
MSDETELYLDHKLKFAKAYPFDRPDHSYLFVSGEDGDKSTAALPDWQAFLKEEQVKGIKRYAVLACGSNASPLQLRRKYAGHRGVIPVVKALLRDHDSVFCPQLAGYGSIAATLQISTGSTLHMHVTFLTDEQLSVMNATEGGYDYCLLKDIHVSLPGSSILTSAFAYLHKTGAFINEGECIALSAMKCEDRKFRALAQVDALTLAAETLCEEPGDNFIMRVLSGKKNHEWSNKLAMASVAYAGPYEKVEPLSKKPSILPSDTVTVW